MRFVRKIRRFFSRFYRKSVIAIFIRRAVLVVFVSIVFLASIFHISYLQFKEVNVFGDVGIDNEFIKVHLEVFMEEGYYLLVIPFDNALIYPRKGTVEFIMDSFYKVGNVELDASFKSLNVTLGPRLSLFRICDRDCYVVDKEFFIYSMLDDEEDHNLPLLKDFNEIEVGSYIRDVDYQKLMDVYKFMREDDVNITSITLVTDEGYDNQVVFNLFEGPDIFVNLNESVYSITRDVYVSLFNVLDYGKPGGRWEDIKYLDTRFESGVYIKENE